MLPVRLEIKNFLAYRTPDPILFDGVHLACLSGPNGAGKSSILDAITWALWGKARGRSDDDLIHIGQDEMQVLLDFLQGDHLYRVLRKRRAGSLRKNGGRSAGTTTLDFFSWDVEGNVFRLINEPSVRATEKAIINLLRLDYTTFVHSAFLQQGRADAFTIKSPGERKEILAEILGLERWARYEEQAKAKLKVIADSLLGIDAEVRTIEREVAEEPSIRAELGFSETQLESIREQVQRAEASYHEYLGADIELSGVRNELATIALTIKEREQELASNRDEIARLQNRRLEYEAVINQREVIEAGYARLQEARQADQALGDTLRYLRDIDAQINDLRRHLDEARQEIEIQIASSETVIDEATQQAEHLDTIEVEKQQALTEIALLEQDEEGLARLKDTLISLKEQGASLQAENKSLYDEMQAIRQRLDVIKATTEPVCPLCGSPLDETHRETIAASFEQEGTLRGNRHRANKEQMKKLTEEIGLAEQEIRTLEGVIKKLMPLRGKLGRLEQQANDAENAARRVQEQHSYIEHLRGILHEERFAEEIRAQLREAESMRDKLGYDADVHDAVRDTLQNYMSYQEQANRLEIALSSMPDIDTMLQEAHARAERWSQNLEENRARISHLENQAAALEVKVEEMQRRRDEWNRQRAHERQIAEKNVALRQKLEAIEQMRRRVKDLREREHHLRDDQGIYEQLKNAFSKSGIPAMLIDAAIPELEETANYLLHKMSSGRMAVKFDTQREKKTGGIAETFDIWIADELGTRDYSMYSGGEAFRVNFAIRIAISQLLARRAGARLRTLFIDEGFGTQDETGRERLIDAINSIQEDFDLVLVITHLDDLRDAFPVRIEVEKLAQGSRVRIS